MPQAPPHHTYLMALRSESACLAPQCAPRVPCAPPVRQLPGRSALRTRQGWLSEGVPGGPAPRTAQPAGARPRSGAVQAPVLRSWSRSAGREWARHHPQCQPTALAAGAQPQNVPLYGRGSVRARDGRCESSDCCGCSCHNVDWAPHVRLRYVAGGAMQGRGSTSVCTAKTTTGMPTILLYWLQVSCDLSC